MQPRHREEGRPRVADPTAPCALPDVIVGMSSVMRMPAPACLKLAADNGGREHSRLTANARRIHCVEGGGEGTGVPPAQVSNSAACRNSVAAGPWLGRSGRWLGKLFEEVSDGNRQSQRRTMELIGSCPCHTSFQVIVRCNINA